MTILGSVRVFSGSTRPITGRSARWDIPVLARILSRSNIATPVVSLPVPEVVGIAMRGFRGPGTGSPWPMGALT